MVAGPAWPLPWRLACSSGVGLVASAPVGRFGRAGRPVAWGAGGGGPALSEAGARPSPRTRHWSCSWACVGKVRATTAP
eukprot:7765110-Alexandrium_andersonii.AAC.1